MKKQKSVKLTKTKVKTYIIETKKKLDTPFFVRLCSKI